MDIFISWSDERGRLIAVALHQWLKDVLQAVRPWMSPDMQKGVKWGSDLSKKLETSSFGIVCVTPESQNAPWLVFEAGVLSKLPESHVCTYLYDMRGMAGPLAQFQHTLAEEQDTFQLVRTINSKLGEHQLEEPRLNRQFAKYWPELSLALGNVPPTPPEAPPPPATNDLLYQLLDQSNWHSDILSRIEAVVSSYSSGRTLMDTEQKVTLASMLKPLGRLGEPRANLQKPPSFPSPATTLLSKKLERE